MAIKLSDNIQTNAPKPTDSRYLNNMTPYSSTTHVNTVISSSVRYSGLTMNINGVEYWYASGTTDSDLVKKTTSSGTASPLTTIFGLCVTMINCLLFLEL